MDGSAGDFNCFGPDEFWKKSRAMVGGHSLIPPRVVHLDYIMIYLVLYFDSCHEMSDFDATF